MSAILYFGVVGLTCTSLTLLTLNYAKGLATRVLVCVFLSVAMLGAFGSWSIAVGTPAPNIRGLMEPGCYQVKAFDFREGEAIWLWVYRGKAPFLVALPWSREDAQGLIDAAAQAAENGGAVTYAYNARCAEGQGQGQEGAEGQSAQADEAGDEGDGEGERRFYAKPPAAQPPKT